MSPFQDQCSGPVLGGKDTTSKFWPFLHDVDIDDGPFIFVPGSHRLTPERLQWEYEQSLTATTDKRLHHSLGSFRVGPDEMDRFGYQQPRKIAVRANTLVAADTYGFHSRSPSVKPTTRVEIHGYMRRNPFPPRNGLDLQSLPGVKGRQLDLYTGWAKLRKKSIIWKDVGMVKVDAPVQL